MRAQSPILVLDFGDCEQCVGVLRDQAELPEPFAFFDIILSCSSSHDVVFLVSRFDPLPRPLVFAFKLTRRSTRQVPESQVAPAPNYAIVASMNLCPGLLQQQDPQFVSVGSAECRRLVLARQKVVHNDFNLRSVLGEVHAENSLLVHLVRDEELPDAVRSLGEHRERAQEVAVAKTALADIAGLNIVSKYLQSAFFVEKLRYFAGSHPVKG